MNARQAVYFHPECGIHSAAELCAGSRLDAALWQQA